MGQTILPAANLCKVKNGKVLKKQAPRCFTGFKACFSTQLTDGLR
jgi:hypothetical protein